MVNVPTPAYAGADALPTILRPGAAAAPFYVTGEDNLRTVVRTSLAVTVTIEGRFLDTCGVVTPFVHDFAIGTVDRSAVTNDRRLGEGWILSLSARVTTGTPQIGRTFVQLRAVRGDSGAAINIGTLTQGYVTESDDLAWPGSPIRSSIEGPGWLRTIIGANPGAGTEFTITQDARTRWRPLGLNVTLTTDATVANREMSLVITNGGGPVLTIPAGVAHVASQSRNYTWFVGAVRGAGAVSLDVIAPLPVINTTATSTYQSSTTNIQAADDYTAPRLLVEEWIED